MSSGINSPGTYNGWNDADLYEFLEPIPVNFAFDGSEIWTEAEVLLYISRKYYYFKKKSYSRS